MTAIARASGGATTLMRRLSGSLGVNISMELYKNKVCCGVSVFFNHKKLELTKMLPATRLHVFSACSLIPLSIVVDGLWNRFMFYLDSEVQFVSFIGLPRRLPKPPWKKHSRMTGIRRSETKRWCECLQIHGISFPTFCWSNFLSGITLYAAQRYTMERNQRPQQLLPRCRIIWMRTWTEGLQLFRTMILDGCTFSSPRFFNDYWFWLEQHTLLVLLLKYYGLFILLFILLISVDICFFHPILSSQEPLPMVIPKRTSLIAELLTEDKQLLAASDELFGSFGLDEFVDFVVIVWFFVWFFVWARTLDVSSSGRDEAVTQLDSFWALMGAVGFQMLLVRVKNQPEMSETQKRHPKTMLQHSKKTTKQSTKRRFLKLQHSTFHRTRRRCGAAASQKKNVPFRFRVGGGPVFTLRCAKCPFFARVWTAETPLNSTNSRDLFGILGWQL